jgi:hypothetical protein
MMLPPTNTQMEVTSLRKEAKLISLLSKLTRIRKINKRIILGQMPLRT